jgi:hypothetical protein
LRFVELEVNLRLCLTIARLWNQLGEDAEEALGICVLLEDAHWLLKGKFSCIQGLPREYPEHRAPVEPPSQGNLKAQRPEGVAVLSPQNLRPYQKP